MPLLTSLVNNLTKHLEVRLAATPSPEVINTAGKCLDLEDILQTEESEAVKLGRERSLKILLKCGEED